MDENTAVTPIARKRRLAALAGLLLAGALTACGSNTGTSTGASASLTTPAASPSPSASSSLSAPVSSTPPNTPVNSAPATTPSAQPTHPGIASGEPAPVKLPALGYQTSGTTLTVYFYGGTCQKYGLKVDESQPNQVGVQVTVTEAASPGRVCSQLVKKNSVTAQLSRPLGSRTVVDRASGEQLGLDAEPAGGPQ
ncbi:hypothetical protein [Kitasatospora sp. MMS16-BH015]|uniref:hypothetical protein n=1 Tax=Kitasatospora sp. MMS16-BH015 TaxID=2018025 RepID=UPI000CF20F78|nr:hypothetical protein [Kitasatospora sp. MMS16-BH015]